MKHIVIGLCMLFAGLAQAQHRHYHHHHHHSNQWGWVAPAIVSGAIVYSLTRPSPPPAPVYYVQQPAVLPPAPLGYQYVQMLDGSCNCYRWVLIPS